MESRSVSGRGTQRLWGLSYAAQCARRRKGQRRLCGRCDRRLDRTGADRSQSLTRPVDARRVIQLPAHRGTVAAWRRPPATMTPVIRDGLALPVVPDADVRALAVYFSDIDHAGARKPQRRGHGDGGAGDFRSWQRPGVRPRCRPLCRRLHRRATTTRGQAPLPTRPELALNSALTLPEPTNFIQVVLKGIGSTERCAGLGDACLRLVINRRRYRKTRGLSASHPHELPALDRPGKQGCCHPPGAGGIALTEREQELCDHDQIQSQWPHRFGAQSG